MHLDGFEILHIAVEVELLSLQISLEQVAQQSVLDYIFVLQIHCLLLQALHVLKYPAVLSFLLVPELPLIKLVFQCILVGLLRTLNLCNLLYLQIQLID